MEKRKLNIVSLTHSQNKNGSFVLMLAEEMSAKRLLIAIGGTEAQSIYLELEKINATRPLTHDLFKKFAITFKVEIQEVIIYNLVEGIFFSKIICKQGDQYAELDARTSDAIAIAVRFNAPVYTYDFILNSAGITLENEEKQLEVVVEEEEDESDLSVEELEALLQEAIEHEDYEKASKIRDEINKKNGEN